MIEDFIITNKSYNNSQASLDITTYKHKTLPLHVNAYGGRVPFESYWYFTKKHIKLILELRDKRIEDVSEEEMNLVILKYLYE